MKLPKPDDELMLTGRGLCFVYEDRLAPDFHIGQQLDVAGVAYEVRGIESHWTLMEPPRPKRGVGLIVVPGASYVSTMTAEFDSFRQAVAAQLDGLTGEQWREQNPGKHLYARYRQYESCAWCGRIKPRGRKPKRCPGLVQIGLRDRL